MLCAFEMVPLGCSQSCLCALQLQTTDHTTSPSQMPGLLRPGNSNAVQHLSATKRLTLCMAWLNIYPQSVPSEARQSAQIEVD